MADMAGILDHIFTPDKLSQINDALSQAQDAQAAIDQAKRAGIDVSAQETELQKSVAQLRSIKQVFYPNQ